MARKLVIDINCDSLPMVHAMQFGFPLSLAGESGKAYLARHGGDITLNLCQQIGEGGTKGTFFGIIGSTEPFRFGDTEAAARRFYLEGLCRDLQKGNITTQNFDEGLDAMVDNLKVPNGIETVDISPAIRSAHTGLKTISLLLQTLGGRRTRDDDFQLRRKIRGELDWMEDLSDMSEQDILRKIPEDQYKRMIEAGIQYHRVINEIANVFERGARDVYFAMVTQRARS